MTTGIPEINLESIKEQNQARKMGPQEYVYEMHPYSKGAT